jgi:hypothetical protein
MINIQISEDIAERFEGGDEVNVAWSLEFGISLEFGAWNLEF